MVLGVVGVSGLFAVGGAALGAAATGLVRVVVRKAPEQTGA
jgi:hypothetical protein